MIHVVLFRNINPRAHEREALFSRSKGSSNPKNIVLSDDSIHNDRDFLSRTPTSSEIQKIAFVTNILESTIVRQYHENRAVAAPYELH